MATDKVPQKTWTEIAAEKLTLAANAPQQDVAVEQGWFIVAALGQIAASLEKLAAK
jgi:hypothetical protein